MKKTTMNQDTSGALFTRNLQELTMRRTLSLLFEKCYCLPFESYCVNPWLIGGVRVARRLSVMCYICFIYLRSVYCAHY
jgi:hypothetical protein